MNHPGEIARLAAIAAPTVALVNNAQREHLEFMASVDAVARENGAAIEALGADGMAVFPADDAHAPTWRELAGARRRLTFALDGRAADVTAHAPMWHGDHWAVALQTPGRRGHASRCTRPARTTCATRWPRPPAALAAGCPLDGGRRAAWRRSRRCAAARRRSASRAAASSARWSTTATTPIPIRCAPRSTCWPRCRRRAGWCSATWARSATQGRRSIARSAPTRASAASRRSGRPGAREREHGRRRSPARAHFADVEDLIAALGDGAAVRVGAGQGLALHAHGARRRRAAPADRTLPGSIGGDMLLSLSQWLQALLAGVRLPARVPVHHLPRRDGGDDLAAHRPGVRAVGDPPARRAEDRPADPRLRRRVAPCQDRHADHGRRADPARHRRLDAALVRLVQPLRLDRDGGDDRLRRDRLGRRLAQGGAARTPRACARARSTSGSR